MGRSNLDNGLNFLGRGPLAKPAALKGLYHLADTQIKLTYFGKDAIKISN